MQQIAPTRALAEFADDLAYHGFRLANHKLTVGLGPAVTAKLAATDACRADETTHGRKILSADATAAGARSEAELFCVRFGKFLLGHVNQNRSDPRFTTYYAKAPSAIVGGDIADLSAWLVGVAQAVAQETDATVAAAAQPAVQLAAGWQAARHGQLQAEQSNRQHGEAVRMPLRESVNALRDKNWLALRQLATANGLGKRWPESFYRKAPKGKPGPQET